MTEDTKRDDKGKFLVGNDFWMHRTSHGRDKLFEDPETLRMACCEYFTWVGNNPLYEMKVCSYEGKHDHEPVAKMRPMTLTGLYSFLDISHTAWQSWRKHPDYSAITEWVDNVIKTQKFEGAAAGLLNANIIARDLGLRDNSGIQQLDKNGEPADPPSADPYIAAAIAAVEKARSQTGGGGK